MICTFIFGAIALIFGPFGLYMIISKKSFRQSLLFFLNRQIATVLLAFIAIIFAYVILQRLDKLIDFSILTAFIVSTLISIISSFFTRIIKNKVEDSLKLTTDYKGLVKKYSGSDEKFVVLRNEKKIPVIVDYTWEDFESIEIMDTGTPSKGIDGIEIYEKRIDALKDYKEELFQAHDTSNVYNQLNIRVDDWTVTDGNVLKLRTSRTTYYTSLMSNRVMDYVMKNGFSVRDLLQPGPFVPDLKSSTLSNHIGFNAIVFSNDGYIPFVKRNDIVSIGKNTYGTSVSASLKTMYALDCYEGEFKVEGIYRAIYRELKDELKIGFSESYLIDSDVMPSMEELKQHISIIAAYRDIVEGNKPQFLVVIRVDLSREEIEKRFKEAMKNEISEKKKKILTKEEKEKVDGTILVWFSMNDFFIVELLDSYISIHEKKYPIVPSVAASILFTQNYLIACGEW